MSFPQFVPNGVYFVFLEPPNPTPRRDLRPARSCVVETHIGIEMIRYLIWGIRNTIEEPAGQMLWHAGVIPRLTMDVPGLRLTRALGPPTTKAAHKSVRQIVLSILKA